jgi:hypothetical protein
VAQPIMPTNGPINPAHLTATCKDLCAALGRLATPSWSDHNSTAPSVAAGMDTALGELLRIMRPERMIIEQILSSQSVGALKSLFEIHGASPYRAMHRARPLPFSEPVKRCNIEQLRTLWQAGFDLSSEVSRMLRQAWRHQNLDYLAFIREDVGDQTRLCDSIDTSRLYSEVPEVFLSIVAAEMKETLGRNNRDRLTRHFMMMRQRISWKNLALVVASGGAVELVLGDIYPTHSSDPLAQIIRKSASAHGRLELHQIEPDLEDLLRRSPDGEFYGISRRDAKPLIESWGAS